MTTCDWEALEALALGELDPERAHEVQAHAASCASCGKELAALAAERALFAGRAAAESPPVAALWPAVAARVVAPLTLVRRRRGALAAAVAVAAATVLFMWRTTTITSRTPTATSAPTTATAAPKEPVREVEQALDKAELSYRQAIAALEKEYASERSHADAATTRRHEARLRGLRRMLDEARAAAGDDVEARLQVLDAYSAYMRSVQTAVFKEEVPR
jgi:hypothetical protein